MEYSDKDMKRAEVEALPGATVLEFGNSWCGHCRRAQPVIEQAFAGRAAVRHLRFADASHKRLGRSFKVKLWPTLVFLKDGKELARAVRPSDPAELTRALEKIGS